jgi:hypothetical protein
MGFLDSDRRSTLKKKIKTTTFREIGCVSVSRWRGREGKRYSFRNVMLFVFLEYRAMDKVQEASNSDMYLYVQITHGSRTKDLKVYLV